MLLQLQTIINFLFLAEAVTSYILYIEWLSMNPNFV